MSIIRSRSRALLQFFRSGPMPCPYIEGEVERRLFTPLQGPDSAIINNQLTRAGFRRSHDMVYRPACPNCQACVPVRIPVNRFKPGRTMRKTLSRNAGWQVRETPAVATADHFMLFTAYQQSRHGDSDMARMTLADYAAMVHEGRARTRLLDVRDEAGTPVAAMLIDRLDDGYSAVYSFFDPALEARSPGTFMICKLCELAASQGLEHVYLGYWIAASPKMAYKTRFRPLEALKDGEWRDISDGD